jgi:hypothetical protein
MTIVSSGECGDTVDDLVHESGRHAASDQHVGDIGRQPSRPKKRRITIRRARSLQSCEEQDVHDQKSNDAKTCSMLSHTQENREVLQDMREEKSNDTQTFDVLSQAKEPEDVEAFVVLPQSQQTESSSHNSEKEGMIEAHSSTTMSEKQASEKQACMEDGCEDSLTVLPQGQESEIILASGVTDEIVGAADNTPDLAADQCEDGVQVSKPSRKRAQKKAKKNAVVEQHAGAEAGATEEPSNSSCSVESVDRSQEAVASDAKGPELTQKQAQALAVLAVRLNEKNIVQHMRAISSRRILLATPVDHSTTSGDDILAVEPGDIVHCEFTDATGWGFGTIVSPLRLAGQRGCFMCESMRPVAAEIRTNRDGDASEFTTGSWVEVAVGQIGSTKNRLREKAALSRLRAAHLAWDKKMLH